MDKGADNGVERRADKCEGIDGSEEQLTAVRLIISVRAMLHAVALLLIDEAHLNGGTLEFDVSFNIQHFVR